MKRVLLIVLAFSIFLFPPAAYGQKRVLNILYTGNLQGELEPCGCSPKTDFGGIARLSGYIKKHKNELSPYILIDAGNFSGEDTPQGRLKTETLLKAFGIMEYDAAAFLKRETVFPDSFSSSLSEKYKVPAVSASHPVSINKNTVELHIGVEPDAFSKGKLNILLTDTPVSGLKEIKGWDVIISSSGEILEEPLRIHDAIVLTGYPKGKKTGMLTLEIDRSGMVTAFQHKWLILGGDTVEDANVRHVLQDYDARVAQLLKEEERTFTETSYLGVSRCEQCHQPFVKSWEKTKHAGAFSDLQRVGKSFDPECVICHTVGFGEEGGFYSIKTTPGLANVQCEACHGMGRDHLADMGKPLKPVTEAVCLKCHTKDRSPDFNYPEYLEKIKH
jgi:hypothetical protein